VSLPIDNGLRKATELAKRPDGNPFSPQLSQATALVVAKAGGKLFWKAAI
jgi:hypothetical protein